MDHSVYKNNGAGLRLKICSILAIIVTVIPCIKSFYLLPYTRIVNIIFFSLNLYFLDLYNNIHAQCRHLR